MAEPMNPETADAAVPRRRRVRRIGAISAAALAVVVVAVIIAVNVFGSSNPPAPAAEPPPPSTTTTTTTPPPPPSPVAALTTIATVSGPVPYFAAPDGAPAGAIPVGSWWGTTKQLPVIATAPGWLQVRLPQRPNGSTGWIHTTDAQLSTTTYAILIDVGARRVRLYDAGTMVSEFPAGMGTLNDPTPLGQYYVMRFEKPPSAGYGPFIIGTNAHSESITSWEGSGDAFTALHGPLGADAAIGTDGGYISHGCVRMHSADLAQLQPVPPGAPVTIV